MGVIDLSTLLHRSQTRSEPPLPPLRLTFYINLAGCISLASCYNLPRALGRLARSGRSTAAAAAADPMAEEMNPLFPAEQARPATRFIDTRYSYWCFGV